MLTPGMDECSKTFFLSCKSFTVKNVQFLVKRIVNTTLDSKINNSNGWVTINQSYVGCVSLPQMHNFQLLSFSLALALSQSYCHALTDFDV